MTSGAVSRSGSKQEDTHLRRMGDSTKPLIDPLTILLAHWFGSRIPPAAARTHSPMLSQLKKPAAQRSISEDWAARQWIER
ncbi:hypothetical protein NliqN6_2324 [Naganishia liquefaciens]|uniref:Uncharacterized protein n=1 Tax=Naganishia liquefaciens TaxID=104408 RepID=A0A8H3TRK0_9TREE|nr:hypothetical protein NliqN6_2324 [Naganishia liquefaciens]